jgi:hypothetical protein
MYLIAGLRAVHRAMGLRTFNKQDIEDARTVLRDFGALLDSHARWDLGHIDDPPGWLWKDRRIVR